MRVDLFLINVIFLLCVSIHIIDMIAMICYIVIEIKAYNIYKILTGVFVMIAIDVCDTDL